MQLASEEAVTKLLSSREILNGNSAMSFSSEYSYNLGEFLDKIKNTPSPYEGKYVFIR